jgi:hypothetical protein
MTTLLGLYSPAPQSGKTTLARHLFLRGYHILPFAGPLKDCARAVLQRLGVSADAIDAALAGDKSAEVYPGVTMRRVLQTLGTEWGRQTLGQRVWVDAWRNSLRQIHAPVVADDVRFENEARIIRDLGGQIWGVVRPGAAGAGTHASESGLPAHLVDQWLLNDTDVTGLLAQADALLDCPQTIRIRLPSPVPASMPACRPPG